VEGEPSRLIGGDLPFRLISPQAGPGDVAAPALADPGVNGGDAAPTTAQRFAKRLPRIVAKPLSLLAGAVLRWIVAPAGNAIFILHFNLRDIRRRNRQVLKLLPDADVYWLHSFFQLPSVYWAARRRKARFLYDTPDAYWEPGQSPATGRPVKLVMRAYEAMERFGVRRAEAFTSVSGGVADLMGTRFGRRPVVVRNLHDLRLDSDPPRSVREVTGVRGDDFLLVMTGNLKPGMAVREALLALRELPPSVHLAFVGRGHGASAEMVRELGLEGRAHLLDPMPPTQIVRFIADADASPILYLPSTNNYLHALPNGFFHAIAAGLPVLYPGLPEIRAIATEHRLGVEIDPGDPASIAAQAGALAADPGETARHRASVERAREVLNWESEESILAELLEP